MKNNEITNVWLWHYITPTTTVLIHEQIWYEIYTTQKHFQKQFSPNKNISHKFGIRDFHYFSWLSYADIDKIAYRHLINLLSFQNGINFADRKVIFSKIFLFLPAWSSKCTCRDPPTANIEIWALILEFVLITCGFTCCCCETSTMWSILFKSHFYSRIYSISLYLNNSQRMNCFLHCLLAYLYETKIAPINNYSISISVKELIYSEWPPTMHTYNV